MNINQINDLLRRTLRIIEEKGWIPAGYAFFVMENDSACKFTIVLRPSYSHPESEKWDYGNNVRIEEQFSPEDVDQAEDNFIEKIEDLLTLDDYLRGTVRQELADLIEKTERLGFAVEYIAILKATAEKMATNALAAPKGALFNVVIDDEVPF